MSVNKVRVLVVDDSALMRKLIPRMLEADQSIEVVGTAMDGNFCLKKIEELKPNVITLDLQMPGMNGIDTLKEIMRLRFRYQAAGCWGAHGGCCT
jgi:two-component system chemotaxis response regulator CheB